MGLAEHLINKGYFPTELPPAFSTYKYSQIISALPNLDVFQRGSSRCAIHSIPRLQHLRRLVGIPNPLHQLRLSALIERHWSDLDTHMRKSRLSLTTLQINTN